VSPSRRFIGLCLAPIIFCLLDNGLTVVGQDSRYWGGNYQLVNEGSPTFHHLLSIHPLAFVGGATAWIAIFVTIILLLPEAAAMVISAAVVLGHSVGAATWLLWHFRFGYQACNALFFVAAMAIVWSLRWTLKAPLPLGPMLWPSLSSTFRWLLIVVLFSAGAYLYLIPRG
jgi:hypothetical protein